MDKIHLQLIPTFDVCNSNDPANHGLCYQAVIFFRCMVTEAVLTKCSSHTMAETEGSIVGYCVGIA